MNDSAIKAEINAKYKKNESVFPTVKSNGVANILRYSNRANNPVINSIVGYKEDIGLPQSLHLPRSNTSQENTGILSYGRTGEPQ